MGRDTDREFAFAWGDGRQKFDQEMGEFIDQAVIEVVADEASELKEVVEVIELLEDHTAEEVIEAVKQSA